MHSPGSLRDLAFLGDGERGALLGSDGAIRWMCAPAWDSDAVFDALLGGEGRYRIAPVDAWCLASGTYDPGSLVWHERWRIGRDVVTCDDALALPSTPHRVVLLRRLRAGRTDARMRLELVPRGRFGRDRPEKVSRVDGAWTWRCGGLRWRLTGAGEAAFADGACTGELHVRAGGRRDVVLEVSDRPLGAPPDPDTAWRTTSAAWAAATPECADTAAPRDASHAYAVLGGLTAASGAVVAAATTALPEYGGAQRNYDYRYTWMRDQCYAGLAAAAHGASARVADICRFVTERVLADGPDLRPAYTVRGGTVPDEHHAGLPGYPGGDDRVGNRAGRQFQLDSLGEALQLFAAADRLGVLDRDGERAARIAAEAVADRWRLPDAGIWELSEAWWTHSRLSAVAGLKALADRRPGADGTRARSLAERILRETDRRCRHPHGYWRRRPDDDHVDAALLLPPVRGAVPAADPRTRLTLDRVRADLVQDGYVYRFRHDDKPLDHEEGAFLLCGFMLALAEWQQGDRANAFRRFERSRAACGAAGLFTEEYDVTERQPRGNLPQAFVHALFLETAVALGAS